MHNYFASRHHWNKQLWKRGADGANACRCYQHHLDAQEYATLSARCAYYYLNVQILGDLTLHLPKDKPYLSRSMLSPAGTTPGPKSMTQSYCPG